MSKLTKLQEISYLLVKIHKQKAEINTIKREIDVLLNSQELVAVTNLPSHSLTLSENTQLLSVNAL